MRYNIQIIIQIGKIYYNVLGKFKQRNIMHIILYFIENIPKNSPRGELS